MGSNTLYHSLLVFLLIIATCIITTSLTATAQQPHTHPVHAFLSHSVPSPTAAPPSHAPAPAPAPFHHHRPHHNHHHHIASPTPAPSPSPTTQPPAKAPTPETPVTKPPTMAPVSQPPAHHSHPPVGSPAKASAPHAMPPRKLVAVQGVVYCKNCTYNGVDTLLGASPLSGAKVELRCRNTKYMLKKASTTDNNGYFLIQAPPLITTYGAHKCRVFLLEKPNNNGTDTSGGGGACSHATNLHGGLTGAFLFLNKKAGPPSRPVSYSLFTVGPFAFAPSKCYKH